MDKKVVFIFLFLFSLTFISASFGYDTAEVIDSEVTVNTYTGNITNLSELQDVDVAGVVDNDVLTYNSATGNWEDQVPALGSETDPKWTGNQSLYYLITNPFSFYNSTDFDFNDYLLQSNTTLAGNYSATTDFCITGGACISGISAASGISWATATNGTLYLSTNPFSFYNSTDFDIADYLLSADWNATNTSYYLATNPFTFWNSTFATFNKTYADTLYLTSYTETDPLWTTNFTAYNSSWTSTYNATYNAYNSTGLIRDWNGTGLIINWSGNYVTLAQLLGFSYYNSTDFDIADYVLYSGATQNVDLGIYNITANWFKGKFNWTEISKYLSFDGSTLDFSEAELNSTIDLRTISNYYNASLISTISGTLDAGNLASIIFPEDGDTYNVSEDVGADPLIIAINFSNVDSFDSIVGRIYYDGGLGHVIQLEIQRSDTGIWENYLDLTDTTDFVNIYVPVFDPELHVFGDGGVAIRFTHVQSGIPTHNFYIDYLTIVDGWTTLTVADHDALGGRDSIDNHPWALPTNGSLRNASSVIVTGNVTASYFLGNGSQLTGLTLTESDPYWTANFTAYNSSWSSTYNLTYDAYNNSGLIIDWNASSLIINWSGDYLTEETNWNANYSDYLVTKAYALNDTDWNATSLIINWNASGLIINWSGDYLTLAQLIGFSYYNTTDFNISDYFLKSDILGFDYYNSTDFDISNYLNSTYTLGNITSTNTSLYDWVVGQSYTAGGITWADATNGTLFTTALYNTNYTANDAAYRNITNTSYYLVTNPYTFWNSTFATFNKTYADTLYDPLGGSETDPLWTDNFTNYNLSWSSITNTSYYLVTNPFGFYNSTDFNINDYLLQSNTTLAGNYSATDFCIAGGTCISGISAVSGISWATATNGTLYLSTNPFSFYNSTNPQTETDPLWTDNFTAYNATWSSTYNSTYDAYNSTGLIINWSGNYLTLAELIAFSYYNSTTFDYNDYYLKNNPYTFWNSTFATFNKTYADTLYGTIGEPLWTDNFTKYNSSWGAGISWANAVNGTLYLSSNPFGFYNSTNPQTETDPLWTDNFTLYNTTWSAGISWASAVNGTLLTTALWNTNYTANNLAWLNTTNTTYNAYNSTGLIIDWDVNIASANTTLYNWVVAQGYTAGGITWADAVNGTLVELSTLLGFDYYNSTDFSISDYFTKSDVLGFDYYNSTSFDINNYYLKSNPFSFYNSTDFSISNYYLNSNPFSFYNSTNPPTETLWNANYSTFLTHIDWAAVANGTMISQATYNTNYSTLAVKSDINVFTANQTIGNNYITNGTGGASIHHNGTGWVIVG